MPVEIPLVGLLLAAAWLLWPDRSRRLPKPPRPDADAGQLGRIRGPVSLIAGLGVGVLLGGVLGLLVGLAAVAAAWVGLGYALDRDDGAIDEQVALQAPDAIGCLVACLSAGTPTWNAVEVVGRSFAGPIGEVLLRARTVAVMGGSPRDCWTHVGPDSPLAGVTRVFIRSSESGTSLTAALTEAAQRLRDQRAQVIERKAQAIGVKAVLPLGLCFLPAFFLLGVVPLVASLAEGLL